jgi:[acyl-carrier-protein] S-malonyltransferase
MNAFLFPGQGSQEIGMGSDLFGADAPFRDLVRRASDRVGADLERICRRGPERELTRTVHLQPLLVCVSLGYLAQLTRRGILPGMVLGHSLGEITALAAAGVITFEAAVDMAAQRGRLMEAAAGSAGGMIAVISHGRERILQWLAASIPAGRLVLANDNAPGQLVLSGDLAALEEAARFIPRERLGRCLRLPVAGAWHSPFMAEAQKEFAAWLRSIPFTAPRVPMLFNASAAYEKDPLRIRDLAVRNLSEPVLWRSCMERLKEAEPAALFEVGPGRILSGLARANGFGDETRICCVNNLRGVELAVPVGQPSPGA